MLAKRRLLASLFLVLTFLGGGCSTNYYTYSGSGIYEGRGGASKNVNGVDIWLVGTPPRKFRIIGYITDSRPGGAIPMARRDADLAAAAKRNGGTDFCSRRNKRIFLALTQPGMRRLSPAVTSPQPLAPAYACRSFGEKGNISSSNM